MRTIFRQTDREAVITLVLYLFFFLWWTFFAFGPGTDDVEKYTYVMGMPAWFFYSCILGYPVITLLLWIALRCFFAEIPLDSSQTDEERQK